MDFKNIFGIDYRPCYIILHKNDLEKKKALFHCWSRYADGVKGIVELQNGEVKIIEPSFIKFCDNRIDEYCFNKKN